ncbi:outer membrane protein [Luteolibacter luteus]|uniref:Porin family protein n=1 Tax=Luteolibacter luteus TaxID=2728835 RepID=A0A858RMV8_9BACT|nr:outer membrane beta-barrel protein [Luteolibacter luteus]QJE97313.1 porin family protein [Luteolibacter luteus]
MNSLVTLGLALGMSAAALAGDTSTTTSYTPAPSASPSLWNWFAGGSVGYLIDNEEAYYTLHAGLKLAESGPITHSLFLEGAYAEFDESFLTTDVIPVTLNYKLDYNINDRFSVYGGVGLGAAFVDTEVGPFSDDSVEFTAQAFVGVGYDVTSNFQIYTGARYIWVDDSEIFNVPVDIGDDVGVELGLRFKF